MNEEIPEYPVDRMQDSNKKIEDINAQIYKLKTVLRQIQQFSSFAKNNNLPENQFQHYLDLCKKYMDIQNELVVEMYSMKDIVMDLLKEWQLAQKSSIIDGVKNENVFWFTTIQEWFSSFLCSLNRTKEMLIEFKEYIPINNSTLMATIEETYLRMDNLITDLISNSLLIEEQPSSQRSQQLIIITKTKFEAKVRLLIASNNISNSMVYEPPVHVRLLNAQEVNLLNNEGIDSLLSKPSICEMTNSPQVMRYQNGNKEFSATFPDLQIEFKRNRRSSTPVAEEKFVLLFVTKVNILNKVYTVYVSLFN